MAIKSNVNVQEPKITYTTVSNLKEAPFSDQRVLILAPSAGTAEARELLIDIESKDVEILLGNRSLATFAYKRFREHNDSTQIDIIPLGSVSDGTKASGKLAVLGTSQENITIKFITGDDGFLVNVDIKKDEDAITIAQKINTAISNEQKLIDSTIDETNSNELKLEFFTAGEMGNKIRIEQIGSIAGVVITIAELTGGSGSFDLSEILDGLNNKYQTFIFDKSFDLDTSGFVEWNDDRFNTENNILGGSGVMFVNTNAAGIKNFSNAYNSRGFTVFGNCDEMPLTLCPLLGAATFGAIKSLRLTKNASISHLVLESNENVGGIDKSSLPYHNTPMPYRAPKKVMTAGEIKRINDAGASLLLPTSSGEVVLGSVVTTYKTNIVGIKDITFKYQNAVDTSLAIQEFYFTNSKLKFGQTRATAGDLVPGHAMTNIHTVRTFLKDLYTELEDLVLVQGGRDAVAYFTKSLFVDLDITLGVYKVSFQVPIMGQLRGIHGTIAISYSFAK